MSVHDLNGRRYTHGVYLTKKCLAHALMIALSFLMLFPFIWMLSISFKNENELFAIPVHLFPRVPTAEGYRKMWTAYPWMQYAFNTLKISVLTIVGQLLVSSMAAYSFARLRYKGREVIFIIFLGTMMVPFQVLMVSQFKIIKLFGWINQHASLWVPSALSVFGIFMLRQFFLTIPKDLEEAARIDGCGYPRIYARIILPIAKPALTALTVITFMSSWNEYLRPLIYINSDAKWTMTMGLGRFRGTYIIEWNQLMAGTVISVAPIVLIFLLGQRFFIEGIAMSGMKE